MTIRYKCKECGVSLKIKDDRAGTEGKCPKCKTEFTVPEPDSATSAPATSEEDEDLSEEDEIFGKDFFKIDDAPKTQKYTMPVFDESNEDDDDSDEEIVIPQAPSAPAASPSSVDTAASIAGGLLSRTGKKNRPSELEEDFTESEEGGYDTSAITYLLLWKVLPCVLGLVILVPLFMYLLGDMFGSGPELPPLGQLEGIVTLDGKVGIAQLRFIPEVGPMDQAKGSMSWAATDANGSYEAMYTTDIPGLVVGAHSVQIAINGMVFERKIEVKEGDNVENFALETPVSAPAQ